MPTLVTDCDDTLIHDGGKPNGEPREHVVGAIKLLVKAGWRVKVWSHGGADKAYKFARKAGLKVDPADCYAKPAHPYTEERVLAAIGAIPDLQFDNSESEAIPGVLFVHTPRTGDYADEAAAHVNDNEARHVAGIIEPPTRESIFEPRKYSPDQPRDDHGRFGEGDGSEAAKPASEGGAQGRVSDMQIEALRQDILNDSFKHEGGGGATMNLATGEHLYAGPNGNAVGVYNVAMNLPEGERGTGGRPSDNVLTNASDFRDAVRGEIDRFSNAFNAPGANLGLWVDQGHLYVDAVYLTRDQGEAAERAVQYGQTGYMEMGALQDTNLTGAQLDQANENRSAITSGSLDPFTKAAHELGTLRWGIATGRLKYSPDQPRDDHGRFGESDGGTTAKPEAGADAAHPFVTSDPNEAAKALFEGKYVELNQERGLSTLLDKLADASKEARAAGTKAPVVDLAKVTVAGTNVFLHDNIGIPRSEMPQFGVKADDVRPGSPLDGMLKSGAIAPDSKGELDISRMFVDHLASMGVTVTPGTTDASNLRASQAELDGVKVAGMMDAMEADKLDPGSRAIWTTSDDYVVDGHHWWAAMAGIEYTENKPMPINMNVIDMPITDALREAQSWTKEMGIDPRAVGKALPFRRFSFKYSDDQERDDHGRFAGGDASGMERLSVEGHVSNLNGPSTERFNAELASHGVSIEACKAEIASKIDDHAIAEAAKWYPEAHDLAKDISGKTGIGMDKVAAALSACSGRVEWQNAKTGEGETKYVRSMAQFVADGKAAGLSTKDAVSAWKADYKATNENYTQKGERAGASIMNSFAEKGMAVLTGAKPIEEILPENKQRSFYDNIMAPGQTREATIDTHMFKVLENTTGVSFKAATYFAGMTPTSVKDDVSVHGVGYIAIAEACRQLADEKGTSPDAVQAAYWLAVQDSPHIEHGADTWPGGAPAQNPKAA